MITYTLSSYNFRIRSTTDANSSSQEAIRRTNATNRVDSSQSIQALTLASCWIIVFQGCTNLLAGSIRHLFIPWLTNTVSTYHRSEFGTSNAISVKREVATWTLLAFPTHSYRETINTNALQLLKVISHVKSAHCKARLGGRRPLLTWRTSRIAIWGCWSVWVAYACWTIPDFKSSTIDRLASAIYQSVIILAADALSFTVISWVRWTGISFIWRTNQVIENIPLVADTNFPIENAVRWAIRANAV